MPRRSELGWIAVMVVVAVTLGFFIGGGPSLLTAQDDAIALSSATSAPITSTTTSTTAAAASEATTTTSGAIVRPPAEVSVRVYNGSRTAGQAVRVGDRLKASGYQVLAPGPSPSDPLAASVVHFVDGFAAEAAALASTLGLPASAAAPMPSPAPVRDVGDAKIALIVADDLVMPA